MIKIGERESNSVLANCCMLLCSSPQCQVSVILNRNSDGDC